MSLTLPYSTAVNCKFVTLPDQLATTDNTLKLYNIDGSVPGSDSYTKAESDARYLKLVSASHQNVSNQVNFKNNLGINSTNGSYLDKKIVISSNQTINDNSIVIPDVQSPMECRFVCTRTGAQQSIGDVVKFEVEPIFQSPFIAKPFFKRGIVLGAGVDVPGVTLVLNNGNTFGATLYVPQLQYTVANVLVDSPASAQTVDRLRFITGVFLKGATNSNYIQVTSADQVDSNKYVRIPVMDAGGDMVVTNPTTGQTFAKNTTFDNGARVGNLEIFNSSYSNSVTITTPNTGNKTATIPSITTGSEFVMTNPTTRQTINTLKIGTVTLNNDYNFINGENVISGATGTIASSYAIKNYVDAASTAAIPKTDIVTTVTGDSDTKVPSEKAVKTYADARATSNLVDNSYTITSTTVTGPTIPSSTIFTTGYRKYCFSWNKDGDATGVKVLNTWTLPDDTFSNISIQGISHLQIPGNSNVSHFKWTGAAILILGSATAAISSYANGNHWSDYDPSTTYPTIIAAGGKNVSLVLNCDSTGNRSKGVFTIETWNIGS